MCFVTQCNRNGHLHTFALWRLSILKATHLLVQYSGTIHAPTARAAGRKERSLTSRAAIRPWLSMTPLDLDKRAPLQCTLGSNALASAGVNHSKPGTPFAFAFS